jgi:hypothetical protein
VQELAAPVEYLPSGQLLHDVEPTLSEYVPEVHEVQALDSLVCPVLVPYLPETHEVQEELAELGW